MRANIPLMPAMRPLNSISNAADSPINMPPIVEATGVNGVMTAMEPCYADQQSRSNIPQS
jgi:hypothetical protein